MVKVETKYQGLTLEESKALSLRKPNEVHSWIVKEAHDRSVSEGYLWYSAVLQLYRHIVELEEEVDVLSEEYPDKLISSEEVW